MVNENDDTTPQHSDDWLLPGPPQAEYGEGEYADAQPPRRRGITGLLKPVGLVVAGLIAGGGVVATAQAVGGDDSGRSTLATPGSQGPDPSGGIGDRPDGQGVPPVSGGAPDFDQSGGRGGLAGEQHLTGTLTAVRTDTVAVKTATGTATYQVTDTTQVVRNGAPAKLSDLVTGDPVLLHVYPASSGSDRMVVERIFAGTGPATN